MAYNSKHTGAEVETLLDRAAGAALTYDISPLAARIPAGNTLANITAEEYEAAKSACDEGRIFVFPEGVAKPVYTEGTSDEQTYIDVTACVGYSWGNPYPDDRRGYAPIFRFYRIYSGIIITRTFSSLSLDTCPTELSQLQNDSGFITEAALAPYAKASELVREVVKVNEDLIGYGTSFSVSPEYVTLAADKFHIVGRCTRLELTLPDGAGEDGREYICQFYVGGSFTLVLPDTVAWLGGNVPTFAGDTCCMLSIVNNCAVIGVFGQS